MYLLTRKKLWCEGVIMGGVKHIDITLSSPSMPQSDRKWKCFLSQIIFLFFYFWSTILPPMLKIIAFIKYPTLHRFGSNPPYFVVTNILGSRAISWAVIILNLDFELEKWELKKRWIVGIDAYVPIQHSQFTYILFTTYQEQPEHQDNCCN